MNLNQVMINQLNVDKKVQQFVSFQYHHQHDQHLLLNHHHHVQLHDQLSMQTVLNEESIQLIL
jgi:hypothetical protein